MDFLKKMASTQNRFETEPLQPAVDSASSSWQGEVSSKVDTIYSEISLFKSSHSSILDSFRTSLNNDAEGAFQSWRRSFEARLNVLNQHKIFREEAAAVSFPWIPFLTVGAIILLGGGLFFISQAVSSASLKRKRSYV